MTKIIYLQPTKIQSLITFLSLALNPPLFNGPNAILPCKTPCKFFIYSHLFGLSSPQGLVENELGLPLTSQPITYITGQGPSSSSV